MKVLQTRAATEPILLVTTCHNMNLLAVVTRSLVAVYRSTTLTVVTTFPIALRDRADTRTCIDSAVCACWSPSGRLLAVGLACGELFLLDVEGGDLVRRFVPRGYSENNNNTNTNSDNTADGRERNSVSDPLRRPPVLSISISGALIACAWAAAAPHQSMRCAHIDDKDNDSSEDNDNNNNNSNDNSHINYNEGTMNKGGGCSFSSKANASASLCLSPCPAATSPVLEEVERSPQAPVLVLLDACGVLCFLPGGLREVGAVSVKLPLCSLDPRNVRVERFAIAASHIASLVLQPRDNPHHDNNNNNNSNNNSTHSSISGIITSGSSDVLRVRMDLRECIAAAAGRGAVALCCVAERCRVAAAARAHAQSEWAAVLRRSRALLCGESFGAAETKVESFTALRDALVEFIAQRPTNGLSTITITTGTGTRRRLFAESVDAAALSAAAADVSRAFARISRQLTESAQRSHDIALHTALDQHQDYYQQEQEQQEEYQQQQQYEQQKEQRQQRLALAEAIAAARRRLDLFLRRARRDGLRECELLRWAAQRSGRSSGNNGNNENSGNNGGTAAASRYPSLLRTAHRAMRPAAGRIGPTDSAEGQRTRERNEAEEKEAEEAEDAAADGALLRVLDECLCASRDAVSRAVVHVRCGPGGTADAEAIAIAIAASSNSSGGMSSSNNNNSASSSASAVRWSGAVDSDGRRAVLWERDGGLALALVGEDGQIAAGRGDGDEDDGIAVLEIKGLAARHVRASVSRARGFGVFYAKERFVVIDFYDS